MRGPKQWAWSLGFAAFFQGATPILIAGGGRFSGIAPTFCLMFIGFWHLYGSYLYSSLDKKKQTISNTSTYLLFCFVLIGIAGAIILPRILQNGVDVLSPRDGLDSGLTSRLKPNGGNYIQSFYLVCIFSLFFILRRLLQDGKILKETLISGLVAGTALAVALGFYQVGGFYLNLPWPDSIINSNIGVTQLDNQTALGVKRMSSTFIEPSIMAMHFLGMFGLLFLGQQNKVLGVAVLMALLVSTSSTAYFGLIALIGIWLITSVAAERKETFSALVVLVVCTLLALSADYVFLDGRLTQKLILEKFSGHSGEARLNADHLAFSALIDSFGLGTGVGSARASSLPASLAATVGIPGLIFFVAFLATILIPLVKSRSKLDRSIFLGMSGLLVGWMISAPDINFPVFWILAAIGSMPERNPAPTPNTKEVRDAKPLLHT